MSIDYWKIAAAALSFVIIGSIATVLYLALFNPEKLNDNPKIAIKAAMIVSFIFTWAMLYEGVKGLLWWSGDIHPRLPAMASLILSGLYMLMAAFIVVSFLDYHKKEYAKDTKKVLAFIVGSCIVSVVLMVLGVCGGYGRYSAEFYDEDTHYSYADEESLVSDDEKNRTQLHDEWESRGYPCTDDCSGHEAGYAWAEENDITDPSDCDGNSQSFIEGCEQWAEEQQEEW